MSGAIRVFIKPMDATDGAARHRDSNQAANIVVRPGTADDDLRLGVGLYPADETRTAVFDYTLDGDVTDYLVVVCFGADGEVASVDMES
jgi:hypothetical protein